MSYRMEYADDGMVNRGTRSSFGTPGDFVESMQKRYEQTMRNSKEDMKKHTIDSRPDMRAFGFATAAIEAGDVEVAAQALAFADGVKSLDAISIKELKDKLAKLEPGARKKFANTYEQNRKLKA